MTLHLDYYVSGIGARRCDEAAIEVALSIGGAQPRETLIHRACQLRFEGVPEKAQWLERLDNALRRLLCEGGVTQTLAGEYQLRRETGTEALHSLLRGPHVPLLPPPAVGSVVTYAHKCRAYPSDTVDGYISTKGGQSPFTIRRQRGVVTHRWLAGVTPPVTEVMLAYGARHLNERWARHVLTVFTRALPFDRVVVSCPPDDHVVFPWRPSPHFAIIDVQPGAPRA